MMSIQLILRKSKIAIWAKLVNHKRIKINKFIYRSYWHFLIFNCTNDNKKNFYFTALPNQGAGIGHQIANWIAGYWFARQFGIKYAHSPFLKGNWDSFLGFGDNEITVSELLLKGYRKVLIPLFDEDNIDEFNLINSIIESYGGAKIIFVAEQDQFFRNQFGVIDEINDKFHHTLARKEDKLIYKIENFNIAIHIRRGDITIDQETKNPNLLMRWQHSNYFENVLTNVLSIIETNKPISIYLFSQGKEADFEQFKKIGNVTLCLEMSEQLSFLHMVFADVLITSKSSFSYKPALLSKGIKVCPDNFWHGYPESKDWILANEEGNINIQLKLND